MSYLRLIALAAIACLLAWGLGVMQGGGWQRERTAAEQAQSNIDRSEANNVVTVDAGRASSDFGDLQLRTRTEAADGRRANERHRAPPAQGTVGAGALVDPLLGLDNICRVERLRGLATRANCPAEDRIAAELARAVSARPVARSR